MMVHSGRHLEISHQFVETMPEFLEEGVLYVSIRHRIALHRCFCGCGVEVSTPLAPTDWKMTFDGATVSLSPSVGVWGLPCQSHYWIHRDRVRWAGKLSARKIERIRERERAEHSGWTEGERESRGDVETGKTLADRMFGRLRRR